MTARRLATILAVVGYSRLVSADEADERPALMSGIGTKRTNSAKVMMSEVGGRPEAVAGGSNRRD